jgi:hypothetical protein
MIESQQVRYTHVKFRRQRNGEAMFLLMWWPAASQMDVFTASELLLRWMVTSFLDLQRAIVAAFSRISSQGCGLLKMVV